MLIGSVSLGHVRGVSLARREGKEKRVFATEHQGRVMPSDTSKSIYHARACTRHAKHTFSMIPSKSAGSAAWNDLSRYPSGALGRRVAGSSPGATAEVKNRRNAEVNTRGFVRGHR